MRPKLSELPDFLPLGKAGSPELRACALGTFTDAEAILDYGRFLKRERLHRLASASAQQANPSTAPVGSLEKSGVIHA